MIAGAHTILYAEDANAARAFLRDVIGLASVDAGEGWLIFELPPSELACHPLAEPSPGHSQLYLMCHDVHATRRELEAKGVEFTEPVSDQGWGLLTHLNVPGFGPLGLYQPRHRSPLAPFARSVPLPGD